jgi:hypothetical protein
MTECFELIDRKLLKGPWVMGEQYTICDPRMAAGYSADENAKLLNARRTRTTAPSSTLPSAQRACRRCRSPLSDRDRR